VAIGSSKVVDASMTRSTKGHRASNNGIGRNVSGAAGGLGLIRAATSTRHKVPHDVAPPPGFHSASLPVGLTPTAGLTNNKIWKSPCIDPENVDPELVRQQEAMLQSYQEGRDRKPAAKPKVIDMSHNSDDEYYYYDEVVVGKS
jgi:hypothetical protein